MAGGAGGSGVMSRSTGKSSLACLSNLNTRDWFHFLWRMQTQRK